MYINVLILLASTLILAGCTTDKQLVATGGSKSDGTVRMSYTYGAFEKPQIDPQQGLDAAKARCAVWGYSGAEPFGGYTTQCAEPSASGCITTQVNIEYQCTGNAKK